MTKKSEKQIHFKKLSSEELKSGMNSIFNAMSESKGKEAREDPLFKYFENNKEWFGNPEDFYTMIIYKFNNIIEEMVKGVYKCDSGIIYSIFKNWDFYCKSVTNLCAKLSGFGCSEDKGRFIVNSTLYQAVSGELPVFNPKPENYHHPMTGTPQEWIDFVYSLYSLHNGNPKKYFIAFKALIDSSK